MCPRCDPEGLSSLFCVFDGTCGDHASDFAQKHFMHYLMQNEVDPCTALCWCRSVISLSLCVCVCVCADLMYMCVM
jgi:hypothetical protein